MKGKVHLAIWLVGVTFFGAGFIWNSQPHLGRVETLDYTMTPIFNHTPWGFNSAEKYWESMQRIDLEVGNLKQFTNLPKLGMKNPYTGFITLGDQKQQFGFIVDIFGEEKRLYIDTDGDGSFAGETYTLLLNEWYGAQIYWVMGPEPIRLKVRYQARPNVPYPLEISVLGYIFQPGLLGKEKPRLLVEVHTWFLAKIIENGAEKLLAVVDQNQNGRFDDPDDLLFIDYNNNGFFAREEAIPRKKMVKLKGSGQTFFFDWGAYPEKLQVKEGRL
jgi:hypothetical protein